MFPVKDRVPFFTLGKLNSKYHKYAVKLFQLVLSYALHKCPLSRSATNAPNTFDIPTLV